MTNISGLGRLDNQISVANVPTKYFNKFVRFHDSLFSIEVEIKILWDKETLLNRLKIIIFEYIFLSCLDDFLSVFTFQQNSAVSFLADDFTVKDSSYRSQEKIL